MIRNGPRFGTRTRGSAPELWAPATKWRLDPDIIWIGRGGKGLRIL